MIIFPHCGACGHIPSLVVPEVAATVLAVVTVVLVVLVVTVVTVVTLVAEVRSQMPHMIGQSCAITLLRSASAVRHVDRGSTSWPHSIKSALVLAVHGGGLHVPHRVGHFCLISSASKIGLRHRSPWSRSGQHAGPSVPHVAVSNPSSVTPLQNLEHFIQFSWSCCGTLQLMWHGEL